MMNMYPMSSAVILAMGILSLLLQPLSAQEEKKATDLSCTVICHHPDSYQFFPFIQPF